MLIIEVHGEQHYSFCSRFHKTKMDFFNSKQRDKDKEEWCNINGIKIIVLKHDERQKWTSVILSKIAE
jgi:hypothetical protein